MQAAMRTRDVATHANMLLRFDLNTTQGQRARHTLTAQPAQPLTAPHTHVPS